jgi:hypothetical protein
MSPKWSVNLKRGEVSDRLDMPSEGTQDSQRSLEILCIGESHLRCYRTWGKGVGNAIESRLDMDRNTHKALAVRDQAYGCCAMFQMAVYG